MLPLARSRLSGRRLAVLLGLFTAAIVLSGADGCSAEVTAGPVPGVPGTGSAAELRLRWAQWRAAGPQSYAYELHRLCFCPEDAVTPARVQVRDGEVVEVRALGTRRPLPLRYFDPIDSLFAYAIRTADDGGPVDVAYHPRLHYPTRLEIGTLANDAGARYEVSALVER